MLWLALPFVGILLSIALGPIFVREWWHIHYGKAATVWAGLAILGLAMTSGPTDAGKAVLHVLLLDYLPFILMLFALFTTAGGIGIHGNLAGSPRVNTALLAVGALLASLIGTTAASMILIRPLIRANMHRRSNGHVIVFFIFLVANIGGALSPLGDPPLFMGFLHGIDFMWPARNLWPHTLLIVVALLAIFYAIDREQVRREKPLPAPRAASGSGAMKPFRITGVVNLPLVAIAIGAIIASGLWHPDIGIDVFGTPIGLQDVVRNVVLVGVGFASLTLTRTMTRAANGFEWEPLKEVAKLFAGIFVCIVPVTAMLQAGPNGPFGRAVALLAYRDGTPSDIAYFWATGLLSSFLDNAPTYLVFFGLAGNDPNMLMGPLAKTLTAISLGAVYMGANTYIGNAPNFMVYAVARRAGMNVPGFLGYMAWSTAILIPLFIVVTLVFLR